ncbi:hypothetical protein, variant 1 [Phytophthora nicotianae]|uniref:Uncharacterized protein n=4 Tax=Phytophthora nicotianae TaxID=4792 RepID=V9FDW9_PHYNI|nr:hypothetical protein F443_06791 [Phytophthora nicotianae P1569]ETI49291.1 hypothetical protein, variant 1 [Phytophthora nicotianae P1569]ETM48967.1 hypothetical protein L914_06576 [Phytophthora nicotianae]ETM48968.1 hypothetical protein, variant 1 [Phytophthora nicotianae]
MASRSPRQSTAVRSPKMTDSVSSSPTSGTESMEAARKRKHRELVKRQYYQKLEVLEELRRQEYTLATQHSVLLRYVQSRPPVATLGGPTASVRLLHERYVQATREKEKQLKANATLRRMHSQHLTFHKKLAAASVAQERERKSERDEQGRSQEEPRQEPESSSNSPASLKMKPVTADACYEVIRAAYAEVCSFRTSRDLYTSNAEVLGWTHRYRLEGEKLQYCICKFFPGRTVQEISDRGWAVMTKESSYKALHSRGMTSNLHDIQTVNEDNRVFCRELQRPGQNAIMKTLLLMSRFETEDGLMTIYRALDHEKFRFTGVVSPKNEGKRTSRVPEPRVVWLDMFAWTSFESRSDGSGVDFHFGGEMKHFSADNAKFWMMEVLLMALRWESRTMGPLVTLHS